MERGRSLLIFKVKGHISRSLDGYLGNFMWFKSNCWFKLKIYISGVCCYTQCCSCFVSEWRRRETANVLNRFVSCFLFRVFWLSFAAALTYQVPRFLSSATWPLMLKKHYNRFINQTIFYLYSILMMFE